MAKRSRAELEQVQGALRTLRIKAGLTQAELARRLGRPQSYVSKYETADRRLDIVEFRQVCAALGTNEVAFLSKLRRARK